ncbi:septum site-determining protein Ssd [Nocardioides marmoraquaticus]
MPAAPLVVTGDPLLSADVQRLAAAAGVVPEVVHDSAAALRGWARAPLVLVGADCAAGLAGCRPPRRPGVHLLVHAPVPDTCFRDGVGLGVESVAGLPDSEAWLVELLTDAGDGATGSGALVGVLGGSGGAGATVFAAALAQVASASHATLLVDADPLGPGADRVLGLERRAGVRWDALARTTGRLSSRSLREALPGADGLAVLTWPADQAAALQPFAVREVLSAGVRGHDLVVVDLPRHPDAVVEEVLARCDHVLVLAQLTVPGVTGAARLVRRLPDDGPALHLVARRGRGGVDAATASQVLRLPLLAEMSDQRGLDEAVDLGVGPARARRGPLARAAQRVVDALDLPTTASAAADAAGAA